MAARAGASSDDAATTDQLAYVDSRHWETTLVRLRVVVRIHRHHTSRRATVT
jgi:hypothetical protein